jgi:hypothetical protein
MPKFIEKGKKVRGGCCGWIKAVDFKPLASHRCCPFPANVIEFYI